MHKSTIVSQQKAGTSAKNPEVTERSGGVTSRDMAPGEVVLPVVVGLEATKVEGTMFNKEKTGVVKKIVNGLVDKKSKSSGKIEVCTAKKDKLRSKKRMQVSVGKQEKDFSKRGRRALKIDAGSPNQGTKNICRTTDMDHKLHLSASILLNCSSEYLVIFILLGE